MYSVLGKNVTSDDDVTKIDEFIISNDFTFGSDVIAIAFVIVFFRYAVMVVLLEITSLPLVA
jgi:hypothetical protein